MALAEIGTTPTSLKFRRFKERAFIVWGLAATIVGLGTLSALIVQLAGDGWGRLSTDFFFGFPSSNPEKAGIFPAWIGSLLLILTTAAVAIPVGVAAGLYLEEYAPKNALTAAIEISVNNLAGVPSILFGLLGLGLFVQTLQMGEVLLTAGITLSLLVLPIVILATREAVRAVPVEMRQGALALGASKWQATRDHVLPNAMPGIVTGVIISMSRAIGETAPLILVGAAAYVSFLPVMTPGEASVGEVAASWWPGAWLDEPFTVMPIQMFNWTSRPQPEFHELAAAAGIVLLTITLLLNGAAIWFRYRLRKRIKW